jgi:hypothetical protein
VLFIVVFLRRFQIALDYLKGNNSYYYSPLLTHFIHIQEEFEDTKGVIRIRISKKKRQHNGQKKKYKMTNNDQQNIHIKLKIG